MEKAKTYVPSWDTTKTKSKAGFDKVWGWADKLGAPVNRLSNRIGSEAFWPTTLDKESYKAARILRSFCKDGFYTEEERPADDAGPKQKQRVLKKIPQKVIENAVGIAIFTTMRTGLWISGAGGSGVLVARKEDGSWSEPSGIMLHTAGLGFLVGVDIYDCVLVINNRKALDAFTKVRATLGGEISAVAGPVGMGGVLENDGKWKQANRPIFTYLKSRGFYAGVQVDGTIVIERTDENARFYGEDIKVADILAGKVRHPPPELRILKDTLKSAEGRDDIDEQLLDELEEQPAPGDLQVEAPEDGKTFGIPEADDPDPYGVLALQKEGLDIVEAGTHSRASSEQFEYNPSPTSPVYKLQRRSLDSNGGRSQRASYVSTTSHFRSRSSVDRPYTASDAGTQTDENVTPMTSPASDSSMPTKPIPEEDSSFYDAEDDDKSNYSSINRGPYNDSPELTNGLQDSPELGDDESPMPTIATVMRPKAVNATPGVVTIPPRGPPPPLPPRNSARASKQEFEEVDLEGSESSVTEKATVPMPPALLVTRDSDFTVTNTELRTIEASKLDHDGEWSVSPVAGGKDETELPTPLAAPILLAQDDTDHAAQGSEDTVVQVAAVVDEDDNGDSGKEVHEVPSSNVWADDLDTKLPAYEPAKLHGESDKFEDASENVIKTK